MRTNAALALGSPTPYPSSQLLQNVWIAILKGLENSHYQPDFTEYRQTNALRHQVKYYSHILTKYRTLYKLMFSFV